MSQIMATVVMETHADTGILDKLEDGWAHIIWKNGEESCVPLSSIDSLELVR